MKTMRIFAILVMAVVSAFGQISVNPTVTVTDTVGPVISASDFQAFALKSVQLIKETGTFPTGVKTSLADPRLLTYVSWSNFVNNSTVWSFVDLRAENGKTVSLSQISFTSRILDGGANSLGKTSTFVNRDYTETAIGIRADGSLITSGPSSQECVRVIVGVGWKSYTATTPAQVKEVKDYLAQFTGWGITSTVTAGSTTTSKTLTTTPPVVTEKPRLSVVKVNGIPTLVVESNGNLNIYAVERATTVNGIYASFADVKAGDTFPLPQTSGQFYIRYVKP